MAEVNEKFITEGDFEEDELIVLDNERGLKVKARVWGTCVYKNKPYAGVYIIDGKEGVGEGLVVFEVMQDPRDEKSAIFIPVHDDTLAQKVHNELY